MKSDQHMIVHTVKCTMRKVNDFIRVSSKVRCSLGSSVKVSSVDGAT